MSSYPDDVNANDSAVPPNVRAQLLATEHWSLLASRSTTQGEVLTRISMFLTLTSAGLVSLALVGQATDFSGAFPTFAIAVLGIVLLVGFLTQLRVSNVGHGGSRLCSGNEPSAGGVRRTRPGNRAVSDGLAIRRLLRIAADLLLPGTDAA